jgi:glucans biosynthesis protein
MEGRALIYRRCDTDDLRPQVDEQTRARGPKFLKALGICETKKRQIPEHSLISREPIRGCRVIAGRAHLRIDGMPILDRRRLVGAMLPASLAISSIASSARRPRASALKFGPAHHFSFEWLARRAASLAQSGYQAAAPPAPDLIQSIDFDVSQKIKSRPEYSLWQGANLPYPVRFFHLNKYVNLPVKVSAITGNTAREIVYSPSYFDYDGTGLGQKLPPDLGFSGFRVMNGPGKESDWIAFQGASYFRTSGARDQYGASARGIAVDTALSTVEEFPRFTELFIGESLNAPVAIYALLEGPSLTGAYQFECVRANGVTMDVHAELFIRADITRLGIAPLTSMYWYGQNSRSRPDWRPQIHDSDGLALATGKGERIWRPLIDPPSVQTNSFLDTNPKGFGLLQRDREFNDYQDDGTFYNKRPSIWVEPKANFGQGAVQLVEIPTDDEIHDNIVAYWQPAAQVKNGDRLAVDYKLYWQDEPFPPKDVGRVVATRIGRGGIPGGVAPKSQWKFVIDFEGGPLAQMATRYDVQPVVTLSRGKIEKPYVIKIVGTNRWRAFFDVSADGSDALNLRCYLKLGDKTLSETWLYQFFPPS